jgi:hypothetical protein
LSAIADAEIIVVLGEDDVSERAPIVDLWLRKARRAGADVLVYGPAGDVIVAPGDTAAALNALVADGNPLGERLRSAERAILIWSGPGGGGGARLAEAAHALGFESKPGSGAFHLPATPNGRGVAEAWSVAADSDESDPEPIGLLVVSGDDAAADPAVRALAERAARVIAITMFHGLAVGWADLVLPATSALERDGTVLNLEGRLQRLRRAVVAPVPDELEWLSQLAGRFDIEVSPHAALVFDEVAATAFGGASWSAIGEQAGLPPRTEYVAPSHATSSAGTGAPPDGHLRLLRYRPLFSGPAVERVAELQFQRPEAEVL